MITDKILTVRPKHPRELPGGMPHCPRQLNEYVEKTMRRGPRPDEVALFKRWAQDARIARRHAADEAAEK